MRTMAFITGSRAYGIPRDDSDVDLVVRADGKTIKLLVELLGRHASDYDGDSVSIRTGGLNLHLCHDDKTFEKWERGTAILRDLAPISREQAVKTFSTLGTAWAGGFVPNAGSIADSQKGGGA